MVQRDIVQIDEEKCDGCGLCVPACAEGAIEIVDGKARLVADVYCDGLGDCLGQCPQDAITIIKRQAEPFDEEAVRQHTARPHPASSSAVGGGKPTPAGCPGAMARNLQLELLDPQPAASTEASADATASDAAPSALGNWPVQLHLVPADAPFLDRADLLLVADCVPFAMADFHRRLIRKRPVVIGCPKLDDANFYIEKLARMVAASKIRSLTVVHMEVPCCTGLVRIAQSALQMLGSDIPLEDVTISIRGKVIRPAT